MSNNSVNIFTIPSQAAFTLVEVVTALFIIMVGIFGGYDLVNNSIISANSISMRLTAAYLGKEGIEIVKSIRDTNYLKIHYEEEGTYNWTNGVAMGGKPLEVDCTTIVAGGCIAQYDSLRLSNALYTNVNQPLKYSDATGYGYTAGAETPYRRLITVDPDSLGNYVDVIVTVSWSDHGRYHSMVVRENVYNWWQN